MKLIILILLTFSLAYGQTARGDRLPRLTNAYIGISTSDTIRHFEGDSVKVYTRDQEAFWNQPESWFATARTDSTIPDSVWQQSFIGLCRGCQFKGWKSTVRSDGYSMVTAMYCGDGVYDTLGVYHPPEPCNTSTTCYRCSKGHRFCTSKPSY